MNSVVCWYSGGKYAVFKNVGNTVWISIQTLNTTDFKFLPLHSMNVEFKRVAWLCFGKPIQEYGSNKRGHEQSPWYSCVKMNSRAKSSLYQEVEQRKNKAFSPSKK